MLLPHAEQAIIPPAKLRDYVLSPTNPVGRLKAVFFAMLGYHQENWSVLALDLREQHLPLKVVGTEETAYGTKSIPRLVTLFPGART